MGTDLFSGQNSHNRAYVGDPAKGVTAQIDYHAFGWRAAGRWYRGERPHGCASVPPPRAGQLSRQEVTSRRVEGSEQVSLQGGDSFFAGITPRTGPSATPNSLTQATFHFLTAKKLPNPQIQDYHQTAEVVKTMVSAGADKGGSTSAIY